MIKTLTSENMGRNLHQDVVAPRYIIHPPVDIVWVDDSGTDIVYRIDTNMIRSVVLSFWEDRIGFSHKDVVIHPLQLGFDMELLLA